MQLVGTPTASKLSTGELLLQFEIKWPGGSSVMLYYGMGQYSGGGLSGLQKHSSLPVYDTLTQAGVAQF